MIARRTQPEVIASLASRLTSLGELLARPVDASSLATFRLLFGLIMGWEVVRYFRNGYIAQYYLEPRFFFTYEFFPFASPLPGMGMYLLFAAMGLFALGIALGFCYRIASLLFFLSYTYVFLLDKTPYNNHYYLIILLSFLLIFVEAQRWASLDKWRVSTQPQVRRTLAALGWIKCVAPEQLQGRNSKSGLETVPFWNLFILRAQILIVYFYGGIAKLNADWLIGEPMRTWLVERAHDPHLGPFFTTEGAVYFFSYGGLFFDLGIGFLLLWKPTRFLAFLGLLFFHLMNNWLFSIGVFPFLALASTILFVEPDRPRQIFNRFGGRLCHSWLGQAQPSTSPPHPAKLGAWTFGFVGFYLALQLLIPLRHWLYPGPVSWTEEGHRFSWHMKLRDKDTRVDIKVIDPYTGETWQVDLTAELTPWQIEKMADRPDMIWQYAHHLGEKLRQAGIKPSVKADVWTSLNGRPYQPLIDPNINLADVQADPLAPAGWILPLQEEISAKAAPVLRWLTIVTVVLVDVGLAWTIYFALGYYRTPPNSFLSHSSGRAGQGHATSIMPQAPVLGTLKVVLNMIIPYLAILLSLAAWVVLGQLIYLGAALSAALLAGAGGFYLAPFLAARANRTSPVFWIPALVSLATSLFLLMIIIVAI